MTFYIRKRPFVMHAPIEVLRERKHRADCLGLTGRQMVWSRHDFLLRPRKMCSDCLHALTLWVSKKTRVAVARDHVSD